MMGLEEQIKRGPSVRIKHGQHAKKELVFFLLIKVNAVALIKILLKWIQHHPHAFPKIQLQEDGLHVALSKEATLV